jgi:site-specific DNA recombinase
MSVFGGMSKGERNSVKIRVRSAMAAQAESGDPFLGEDAVPAAEPAGAASH